MQKEVSRRNFMEISKTAHFCKAHNVRNQKNHVYICADARILSWWMLYTSKSVERWVFSRLLWHQQGKQRERNEGHKNDHMMPGHFHRPLTRGKMPWVRGCHRGYCRFFNGTFWPFLATKIDQARRFNDPNDNCKVLIASDAVGMGLNL